MSGPATRLVGGAVLALAWTLALAFLLKGHAEAGDGFSAGLTAAAGVLIHRLVAGRAGGAPPAVFRHGPRIAGIGLLVALLPVVVPVLAGDPPLQHYPAPGSAAPALGVLTLQSGLLIDLGVLALVLGFVLTAVDLLARAGRSAGAPEA